MKRNTTRLLAGALFVTFGALLLLHQMHIWSYNDSAVWGILMTVGGLVLAGSGFADNRKGKVFFGTWAFLYGLFLVLRLMLLLSLFPHIKIFALLLSLALSFLMIYLLEPRNFGNLVSALCLGGMATWVYFQATNDAWAEDLGEIARVYWPVILILFGINAMTRRK